MEESSLELIRDASSPGTALLAMYHCPDVTWKVPRTLISWKILGYLEAWGQGFCTYLAKGQSKAVGSIQFSLPFSHLHLELISKVDFGDNFNYFGTWRLCLSQTEISEPFH